MKIYNKIFCSVAFSLVAAVLSCNNTPTQDNAASGGADAEGLEVMKKYDCATCHNATAKIVGPSFKDIAAKYTNTAENISLLASKVITGGGGVWGSVPMAAHPTLPKEDAEKIVSYILSSGGK